MIPNVATGNRSMRGRVDLGRYLIAITVLGSLTGVLIFGATIWHRDMGPPKAVATPISQRIEAKSESERIVAKYKVTNVGGQELIFGKVSTTCGCSVASIEPKSLKSGEHGEVTILGSPVAWSEKTVQARIACNASPDNELVLELTMVGSKGIPYYVGSSGPAQFGILSDGKGEASIEIRTFEATGTEPWIQHARTEFRPLKIAGGISKEVDLRHIVQRTYHYKMTIEDYWKSGEFKEEVQFLTKDG
jgi:hypothetical protein